MPDKNKLNKVRKYLENAEMEAIYCARDINAVDGSFKWAKDIRFIDDNCHAIKISNGSTLNVSDSSLMNLFEKDIKRDIDMIAEKILEYYPDNITVPEDLEELIEG